MRGAALALLLAACGSNSTQTAPDLGMPLDFSVGSASDLSFVLGCMATGTHTQKFVVDSLTLPMSSNDFALDLNGDGHADNRFGNIYGALKMQNLDLQPAATQSITSGANVILLTERSSDPQLQNDACAATVEQQGLPQTAGSSLAPDSSFAPGNFTGSLAGGRFNSGSPITGADVQVTLLLPMVGGALTKMPLHGAHIQYQLTGGALMTGQINGGVLATDVQMTVIPEMAKSLTQRLDPDMGGDPTLASIFDTGGSDDGSGCVTKTTCPNNQPPVGGPACKNPAFGDRPLMCADQCDNIVDTCEVSSNQIIKNLLAPDVQLFQNGVYAPSPANKMKDALSVGVGFTATGASF